MISFGPLFFRNLRRPPRVEESTTCPLEKYQSPRWVLGESQQSSRSVMQTKVRSWSPLAFVGSGSSPPRYRRSSMSTRLLLGMVTPCSCRETPTVHQKSIVQAIILYSLANNYYSMISILLTWFYIWHADIGINFAKLIYSFTYLCYVVHWQLMDIQSLIRDQQKVQQWKSLI